MVPTVVVLGVGAVRLAVPPVGSVYHCNVFPVKAVAVKAEAVSFWQYATSLTAGATGNAFTIMDLLFEYEQLLNVYKYVIVTEPSAFAVATPV